MNGIPFPDQCNDAKLLAAEKDRLLRERDVLLRELELLRERGVAAEAKEK